MFTVTQPKTFDLGLKGENTVKLLKRIRGGVLRPHSCLSNLFS